MGIAFDDYDISQVAAADTQQTTTDGRTIIATGETGIITEATATNESAATETLSIHIQNPDAAAAAANVVIDAKGVLAGQEVVLAGLLGRTMKAGSSLRTVTGTGSAINLHISLTIRT